MIEAQQGAIAQARTTGPLPTPAEGFADALANLDRLARELAEEREEQSVDVSPDDDP